MFRKGDLVKYVLNKNVAAHNGILSPPPNGAIGEIRVRDSSSSYGVVFKEHFSGGHDLNGACDYGFGWWAEEYELELYVKPKPTKTAILLEYEKLCELAYLLERDRKVPPGSPSLKEVKEQMQKIKQDRERENFKRFIRRGY